MALFSGGLVLKAAKRPRKIAYRPAGPALVARGDDPAFQMTVPNVLGITTQFKPLTGLWNSCVEDLAAYPRAQAQSSRMRVPMKVIAELPSELHQLDGHPIEDLWREFIARYPFTDDGELFIVAGDVATLWMLSRRDRLTLPQSRELAGALASLGYAVEPDARVTNAAYGWDQPLALFVPEDAAAPTPSERYLASAALLELSVLVAAADEDIAEHELDVVHRVLAEAVHLTPVDRQWLLAAQRQLDEVLGDADVALFEPEQLDVLGGPANM